MKNAFTFTLVLLLLLSTSYAQTDLENGLVAYYPFSANYLDQSIYSNNAAAIFGTSLTDGYDNEPLGAVSFDGIDDYIDIPHAEQINFESQTAFTISVWVKIPENQADPEGLGGTILSKWENAGTQPYPYTIRLNGTSSANNGKISAGIFQSFVTNCVPPDALGLVSTTSVNDNAWHHIVFARNDDNMLQLYIDCKLEAEVEDPISCSLINDIRLLLGIRVPGGPDIRPLTGSIDELRMYNRFLNPTELNALCGVVATAEAERHEQTIAIYPNPVKSGQFFFINTAPENTLEQVDIFSISGAYLGDYTPGQPLLLPNGAYSILITLEDGNRRLKKLIVTH
jgi:hypothetical protein